MQSLLAIYVALVLRLAQKVYRTWSVIKKSQSNLFRFNEIPKITIQITEHKDLAMTLITWGSDDFYAILYQ